MKFDLEDRLIDYSVLVLTLVEQLPETRICNHLAGQLIRSCTSPALTYGEALGAESRRDFIHKMKMGLKELRETRNNLRIISRKQYLKDEDLMQKSLAESEELIRIFVKSIQTALANLKKEALAKKRVSRSKPS